MILTLKWAWCCPECFVLYGGPGMGCEVCEYEGDLDKMEVCPT